MESVIKLLDESIDRLKLIQLSYNYSDEFPELKELIEIKETTDPWALKGGFLYEVMVSEEQLSYFKTYNEVFDFLCQLS